MVIQGLQFSDPHLGRLATNLALDLDQAVQVNAYLTPVMNAYLDRLEPRIDEVARGAKLYIIQANGGATTVENARRPRASPTTQRFHSEMRSCR